MTAFDKKTYRKYKVELKKFESINIYAQNLSPDDEVELEIFIDECINNLDDILWEFERRKDYLKYLNQYLTEKKEASIQFYQEKVGRVENKLERLIAKHENLKNRTFEEVMKGNKKWMKKAINNMNG